MWNRSLIFLVAATLLGGCVHHVDVDTAAGSYRCPYRNHAEYLHCLAAVQQPLAPGVGAVIQPALYIEPGYPADIGVNRWEQFQQLTDALQAQKYRDDQLARQNAQLSADLASTRIELADVRSQLANAKQHYAAASTQVDALRKSGTATSEQLSAAEKARDAWKQHYCDLEAYSYEVDKNNPSGAELDQSQRLCKE